MHACTHTYTNRKQDFSVGKLTSPDSETLTWMIITCPKFAVEHNQRSKGTTVLKTWDWILILPLISVWQDFSRAAASIEGASSCLLHSGCEDELTIMRKGLSSAPVLPAAQTCFKSGLLASYDSFSTYNENTFFWRKSIKKNSWNM